MNLRAKPAAVAMSAMLAAAWISPAHSQDAKIEMHWVGLFGEYSAHPVPNDPLPDVTLFPFGELPRPLARTDRVPAKLGSRFGLLFTLHGPKEGRLVTVVQVVHYPSPGLSLGPGVATMPSHEDRMLCMMEQPCYVGYRLQQQREILPGEWRMELFFEGAKIYEATFVVEQKPEMASNILLEHTRLE